MVSDIHKIGFLLLALFGCNGIRDGIVGNDPGRLNADNVEVVPRGRGNAGNDPTDVINRAQASVNAAYAAVSKCRRYAKTAIRASDEAKAAAEEDEWDKVSRYATLFNECNCKISTYYDITVKAFSQVNNAYRTINSNGNLLRLRRQAKRYIVLVTKYMSEASRDHTEISNLYSLACMRACLPPTASYSGV